MPKSDSTNESFIKMIVEVADLSLTDTERRHMNGPWRVWEAVLHRLNNYGHAPFRPGELAKIVCGADTPSNRNRVRDWMKGLAAMERIAPLGPGESTQLCILVNTHVAYRGAGKAMNFMCWEPSHADIRKMRWPDGDVYEYVKFKPKTDDEEVEPIVVGDGDDDPWAKDASKYANGTPDDAYGSRHLEVA